MKKKILVVLGMHRSGTSAVARGTCALGCEFGNKLWPPNVSNVTGFFENVDIANLDDELLHVMGVEWHSVAQILEQRFDDARLKIFQKRAIDILNRQFVSDHFFGFKCPRACRLLPFWQSVFSDMGLEASYVIVIRNPLSIAKSLEVRDGFPPEKSFLLWMEHVLPVVRYTHGLSRVFIDYDIMIDDPISELMRVARKNNIDVDYKQEQALEDFTDSFLKKDLRHTRYSSEDIMKESSLPAVVAEAYNLLFLCAQDDEEGIQLKEKWEKIERAYRCDNNIENLTNIFAKFDKKISQINTVLENREKHIINLTEIIKSHEEHIKNLKTNNLFTFFLLKISNLFKNTKETK